MSWKKRFAIGLSTLLAAGVLGAVGAAGFVWGGFYDVSATGPHWQAVHSLLEVALKRAVQVRADAIPVPASFDTPPQRLQGAACFQQHCVACHGAPGVAPQPFALGMQPVPSSLIDATRHWRSQDLYWITRHGVKMSGMPAWEYRLNDEQLWSVVAFLGELPRLSPQAYQARAASPVAQCTAALPPPEEVSATLSRVDQARRALQQHGCIVCHTVPGVVGPGTSVGPPLEGLARRDRIAGKVPPTVEGLAAWIRDPQALDAHTAMPTVPVSEAQARLMAEYLLRD